MSTRGSNFLGLDVGAVAPRHLTTWLTEQIRVAIDDGTLPVGSRLPPSRALAEELDVARGVVVEAYRRLGDEALVIGRPGVGTVVADHGAPRGGRGPQTAVPHTTDGGPRMRSARHASMERHTAERARYDLSPGVPELGHFPRTTWLRAERAALTAATDADLGYGDPRGAESLRTELAGWLARTRRLQVSADQIIIISGVAQGLTIVSHVLRSRGHSAIGFENPGSRGARDTFAFWGLEPVPIPVDAAGLRVADLAESAVRSVFVTPAHQYPTGVVLDPSRRRELLNWAADRGGVVVEDDYDAEHRYDRKPVAALARSAPERVVHLGSVSKILAPGLRLGWLIAPPDLFHEALDVKYALDLGSPVLPQLVLTELLRSGAYERHQRLARARNRGRRDALVHQLHRQLPNWSVAGVAAGLHVLLQPTDPSVAESLDDVRLAEQLLQAGVAVHPLSHNRIGSGAGGLVLGYGALSEARLVEAADILATVITTHPPQSR